MAMGATSNDIQRLVLGKGALLTAVGMGIGLPVAFVLANALSSLLFGVKVADPIAFIVIPLSWQPWPRWRPTCRRGAPCAWIRLPLEIRVGRKLCHRNMR